MDILPSGGAVGMHGPALDVSVLKPDLFGVVNEREGHFFDDKCLGFAVYLDGLLTVGRCETTALQQFIDPGIDVARVVVTSLTVELSPHGPVRVDLAVPAQ